jgi:8-oxo-dGTP pyrophosphatase MutT (NUDIX family)
MHQSILNILEKYKKIFPSEIEVNKFLGYLNNPENFNGKCVDRKNMNGHVTVSALVVEKSCVLMLWHKTFQRLQQPGGHIDPPDKDLISAVVREVIEETGLVVEPDKITTSGLFSDTPILLAINNIPERKEKQEGVHKHFDFWFLLKLKDNSQEIKNVDEGTENAQWVPINEVTQTQNPTTFKAILRYNEFYGK